MSGRSTLIDGDSMGDRHVASTDDPVDALIPPPRSHLWRVVAGLVVLTLVGGASFLIGFGYLYPRPGVGGLGDGGMAFLANEGEAVRATQDFYNFSRATLLVTGADVDLPGASIVAIGYAPAVGQLVVQPFPVEVEPGGSLWIVVDLVPDCEAPPTGPRWGTTTVHLKPVDTWLPTLSGDYQIPGGLLESDRFVGWQGEDGPPAEGSSVDLNDERAVACALMDGQ